MSNPPEYRRFRQVLWGLYAVAVTYACACLFLSGYREAHARWGIAPPAPPRGQVGPEALVACTADLEKLHAELVGRLDAVLKSEPARMSGLEWEEWSPSWRARLLGVGARCRLDQGDVLNSASARVAYRRLAELQRHFTTLAVQFAGEVGPHADRTRQAVEAARGAVGR